ncbi:MAG TPA: voltage-dependent potassium channel subunit beta [candidate division Zixibacteria bacterium]|nr:voltage-dependent potassium channel subunit beta [candidate division Zixibacteria bacterium]
MEYRHLGSSGLQVSALSYGAWVTFSNQFKEDLAYELMKTAIDSGINFFDNAEVYANGEAEIVMGKALKIGGWKRSDLVISTKIFWGGKGPNDLGLSRKHIIEGTDAALARLQLDYVDLIFCHRPDIRTPIEETVRAMNFIINQGKAFYWGTSEWSAEQLRAAYEIARREHLIPPTMEQPQYNMFVREKIEKEYLPLFDEFGLGTTIWSPLSSGILTGKYNNGIPENTRVTLKGYEWLKDRIESDEGRQQIEIVKKLTPVAKKLGGTMAQLALAWCLKNKNVSTVITGATKIEQLNDNLGALDLVDKLTPEIMDRIDHILDNKPAPPIDFRTAFD